MSHSPLRIVGQGLAGSLLAWECECAGVPFRIFDLESGYAASQVAAGILNPITGQRVVKSWRVDELLPLAIAVYRKIEHTLGETVLHSRRVRRFYRDAHEREIAEQKHARGELDPYVRTLDAEGFWIESAFYLDARKLVERLRARWIGSRQLMLLADARDLPSSDGELTVWCLGAGELARTTFAFAPLQPAKGQILRVSCASADPGVILNDGHWALPVGDGQVRIGATFERGDTTLLATLEARRILEDAAKRLLRQDFEVTGQDVGVRVTTADKHPIAGLHPKDPRCGVINGLGSKGGLLAPWLARQWLGQIERRSGFDPAVDVARFVPRGGR